MFHDEWNNETVDWCQQVNFTVKTNRNRPTHYTWYPYKGGATVTNIPGSFQSKMFQLNSVQLAQRMKRTISVIFGCKTKFASDVSDRRLNTDSSTAETWLTVHASGRCAPAGRHFFLCSSAGHQSETCEPSEEAQKCRMDFYRCLSFV